MMPIRADLPPLPDRMKHLPADARGYPVPWFVAFMDDGKPDFRVIRPGGVTTAIKRNVCWLCGQTLGVHKVFVIGPMCAINRTTSEPPSHHDCAAFAVKACPFMTRPMAKRSTADLPPDAQAPAGIHLDRNPGAICMWTTRSFETFRVRNHVPASDGLLIQIGEPESVSWWAEGRAATLAEVKASLDSGMPKLRAIAEQEGRGALDQLARQYRDFLPMLPQGQTQ